MSTTTVTIGGVQHTLTPLATPPTLTDTSFTLSWSIDTGGFASFHDYIPDAIFNTRERLFSLKNGKLFIHHSGPPGLFYDTIPHPFFIDVIFKDDHTFTLDSVEWFAEVMDPTNTSVFEKTLTHITIQNNYQSTGRIPVTSMNASLFGHNARNTGLTWTINSFRDIVKTRGIAFIDTIFNDYRPLASNLNSGAAWFNKRLLQGKHFAVRFEYDNMDGNQIALKEVGINATPGSR